MISAPAAHPFLLERPMNLVDRVKRILLSPQPEWEVIDGESTTPSALYTGYIMPLAAIGPIANVIGYSVFGIRVPFGGDDLPDRRSARRSRARS